ncbi:hypothetical protein CAPTEDRAFT_194181 [Capitella teleta]|uniref:Glutamyl-tRNA(Gln) amidotransferase subunit C, mitochondrial n=1 Tax=Capitella teleta TaxID=283909 RepID=R7TA47_CAPTE|nr:hypothetical protein CAPTEDRAFT_194181 [Capitella teleta]|eukprot:ELT90589.1 hypothetical protein CAPTEDRAFT_194181 [Capitella teleta]
MVNHLERLALVDFGNEEGVERLATAVKFADQLRTVDTSGVAPMTSVLEYWPLYLRDDQVTKGDTKTILKNAQKLDEDYFVAPPGNIPLKQSSKHKAKAEDD